MKTAATLFESSISNLTLRTRGKVRDIYAIDNKHLLIVTTDRLSAFDVVLPNPVPGKGVALTSISNFWFNKMQAIIPNHLTDLKLKEAIPNVNERAQIEGRAIIVKKLQPLPIEAIVRGYLAGSGWKDYQQTGSICGIELVAGLQQAQQLPKPIYTPSSKATGGGHDENITFTETVALLGINLATQVMNKSIQLYTVAAEYAKEKGIIIADTKFEFGLDDDNKLYLIDEVLTPDSSRFWPVDQYQTGISPPSFDKQFIRDYLETLDWDKTAPGPKLPDDIITISHHKYHEAALRLTSS